MIDRMVTAKEQWPKGQRWYTLARAYESTETNANSIGTSVALALNVTASHET